MSRRLFGRLCLTCGFVVHSLHEGRPFPVVRRCGLCRPIEDMLDE
jgi:hypothetical protein